MTAVESQGIGMQKAKLTAITTWILAPQAALAGVEAGRPVGIEVGEILSNTVGTALPEAVGSVLPIGLGGVAAIGAVSLVIGVQLIKRKNQKDQ